MSSTAKTAHSRPTRNMPVGGAAGAVAAAEVAGPGEAVVVAAAAGAGGGAVAAAAAAAAGARGCRSRIAETRYTVFESTGWEEPYGSSHPVRLPRSLGA